MEKINLKKANKDNNNNNNKYKYKYKFIQKWNKIKLINGNIYNTIPWNKIK